MTKSPNLQMFDNKNKIERPPSPPLLIRQYATWDEESLRIESERVQKVIQKIKNQKIKSEK